MKLLHITTKYFLILIVTLLVLWCAVFYFSLRWTVYSDIDEYLTLRQHQILKSFRKNPNLISQDTLYQSDFRVSEISKKEYRIFSQKYKHGNFKDTKVYDELERAEEPFRKLESVFEDNGKYYKLYILASFLNSKELLFTILLDIFVFSIILFGLVSVLNKALLRKLWKPFYETIDKIKQYKLDKGINVDLTPTNISEFNELNYSIEELIINNLRAYLSQKQFIENASHEMQTPLGIMRNKVDLLLEVPSLNTEQAILVDVITDNIDRLARLNKSLLLLSKIENNHFFQNDSVDITQLIEECHDDFSDLIEFKRLGIKIHKQQELVVIMNSDLARILLSNLIKNATNHNIDRGYIEITINAGQVIISNSGKELHSDPELLFERFNKTSNSSQSNGLGLAIVKSICVFYNFSVSYSYFNQIHVITLTFYK